MEDLCRSFPDTSEDCLNLFYYIYHFDWRREKKQSAQEALEHRYEFNLQNLSLTVFGIVASFCNFLG